MELNFNDTFAETLQRYNLTVKCDISGLNCTLRATTFDHLNSTYDPTQCQRVDMASTESVFMVLYSIVGIIGLLGNTLVIYVVLRFPNMRSVTTNMYILNLAIADECYLIGIPFLIATMKMRNWPFGNGICKAYMVSTSITQFASSIFLLVMSGDRYVAICHHETPRYRSARISRIVSSLAWCVSTVIMMPILIYSNAIEQQSNRFTCNIEWPESESSEQPGLPFTLYSLSLGFAIPLCFIMTFYCLVIRKLRRVGRRTSRRSQHRKVTRLVLRVVAVYFICWCPHWLSQIMLIMTPPEVCYTRVHITIFLLVGCLGYFNSALNPILYAYLSDNFKKSFMKACKCVAKRDYNSQLKLENSIFSRKSRKRSLQEVSLSHATRTDLPTTTTTIANTNTQCTNSNITEGSPSTKSSAEKNLASDLTLIDEEMT